MAETPCILGQSYPVANTELELFFVPMGTQVQCSIFVANHANEVEMISIALIPGGTSPSNVNYIAFNTPMSPNSCIAFAGIFLSETDKVRIKSQKGKASFTATGMLMT